MIWISLAVGLWLGSMLFGASLGIYPKSVLLIRRLVCPPGMDMEVHTFVAGYHRPGERGIEIYAVGDGVQQDIKGLALFTYWGLLCLVSFIPSVLLAFPLSRWLAVQP